MCPRFGGNTKRDEVGDAAIRIKDAQCAITGIRELGGSIDHVLEDGGKVQTLGDAKGQLPKQHEPVLSRTSRFPGACHSASQGAVSLIAVGQYCIQGGTCTPPASSP